MLAGFFEFFGGLGQDLGEHRVFGIEVEVETGAGYPARRLIARTDNSANGVSSSSSRAARRIAWRCLSPRRRIGGAACFSSAA